MSKGFEDSIAKLIEAGVFNDYNETLKKLDTFLKKNRLTQNEYDRLTRFNYFANIANKDITKGTPM